MVILGRGLDGLNLATDSLLVGVSGLLDEISVGTLNQVLTVTPGGLDWADAPLTGLQNIVEDTTPQLGGELDAQTVKIVNLGEPTLAQDAATKNYVDTQITASTPIAINDLSDVDAPSPVNGDVLVYNNISGNWEPQAGGGGGGINNVVEDTTPQLGGDLDAQGAYAINNLIDPTLNQDAATKIYVDTRVANVIDSAPALLDTLNELAAALGDDENFSTTVTTALSEKVAKAGDTMTGLLTLSGDPTTALQAATKQYVDANVGDVNTMSNLAGGTGVFKQKVGVDFEMHSLLGTGGTTVSLNADVIEIDSTDGTLTQIDTGAGISGGPITTTGTIILDINGLDLDAGIDGASDFIAYHDASTGLVKKVLINSLGVGDLLAANNLSELTGTQVTARGNIGAASASDLTNHTTNTSNPHAVTAAQTGAVAKIGDTMSGALQFNAGASLTSDTGVVLDISAATGSKVNIEGNSVEIQGTDGTGGQVLINADGSIQLRPAIGFDLTLGDDIIIPFSIGTPNQILQVDATGTFLEFAVNAGGGVNTLNDLSDTTIAAPADGNTLRYNGATWVNAVLAHADLSGIGTNTHAQIDTHISDVTNPHSVTAAQVGALASVVEDLSPQLGGDLDVQARAINTSVVNGDISIVPDGTGKLIVGDGTGGIITATDAPTSSNAPGHNLTLESGDGDGIGDGGNILITPGTAPGAGTDGLLVLDGLIWPLADGTIGQVITTDGSGNLSFTTAAGSGDPDQNLWDTFNADSGTTSANTTTDALTISGGTNITTAIVGDVLTINTPAEVNQDGWSIFSLTGNTGGDVTVSAVTKTDAVTFVGGANITLSGNDTTKTITIDASGGAFTQNLWETIVSDSGSVLANTATDTLTLAGGAGISTSIAGDTVTFINDSPNVDQNIWATINSDSGSTSANATNDNLFVEGGTGISTAITADTLTITNSSPNIDQNIWATVNADSGTTVANTTTDALTITGGTNVTTAIVGDVLTINASGAAGDPDQNLWETVTADSGSTVANTITDTLIIAGGTNVTTAIVGDTLTINAAGGAGDPDQNIWATVNADSGTTVADIITDALTVSGGTNVTTAIVGDVLTINSTGTPDQNIWSTVNADTGTTAANTTSDALTVSGGTNVTTAIVGDVLTINSTGTPDQNLWATFNADSGTTSANIVADAFTITGGAGISTAIAGDVVTITNDSPNVDQSLWATVTADSGSAVANTTTDTLTITGGTNVTTTIVGDTLTIDAAGGAGDPDQNIWETVAGDTGSTAANTITDTLTIAGGTNVTTTVVGDTLTIDATGGGGGASEERFKLNYDPSGLALLSTSDLSAGVVSAVIAGSNVAITFTGHAYPPSSILIYGYAYTANEYNIRAIDGNFSPRKIDAGGSSGSPTAFGAFAGPMTLELQASDTGASQGFSTGSHAWITFVFGD